MFVVLRNKNGKLGRDTALREVFDDSMNDGRNGSGQLLRSKERECITNTIKLNENTGDVLSRKDLNRMVGDDMLFISNRHDAADGLLMLKRKSRLR